MTVIDNMLYIYFNITWGNTLILILNICIMHEIRINFYVLFRVMLSFVLRCFLRHKINCFEIVKFS